MDKLKIRNFAIIAHIDHGKSTLADRILEITKTIKKRDLKNQHLDSMDLEQERGITIKLNAVQIKYQDYIFHLIDTPGHVDFTYEVSRSLAACEGVILLVDATQGIEAQTLANVHLAIEHKLEIVVVLNKIDLPSADVTKVKQEIKTTLELPVDDIIPISAKTGQNIELVLKAIIKKIHPPKNAYDNLPLKALVFDSYFDIYRGVVLLIRIFEGSIKIHDHFMFMNSKNKFHIVEIGIKNPNEFKKTSLVAGEVGYITASIRNASQVAVGDTITLVNNPTKEVVVGYKKLNPVVFTGFFPVEHKNYNLLKESLKKIALSDSSIDFEQETSQALGHGFRVGFLGMLHMEVLKERLDREFNLNLIATIPSVKFHIYKTNNKMEIISSPAKLSNGSYIKHIEEPMINATIIIPKNYIGVIMELCHSKRGVYKNLLYLDKNRCKLKYQMPLIETIVDFFDKLKSLTKGYATFDYVMGEYKKSNLTKVDVLLNGKLVDAFSFICHKDFSYKKGQELTSKLKEVIPKHNFEIAIQATIGGKIIARSTIKAYRKNVTAKLYGGDRTRKDKLLKKQKAGKKKSRAFGNVKVPQQAFLQVLKTNNIY